jgi:hypothetical protein
MKKLQLRSSAAESAIERTKSAIKRTRADLAAQKPY